jgi:hypothetical protein
LQVNRLSHGDHGQEPPKIVAILEIGKSAALCSEAQALEGAQRDILIMTGQRRNAAQAPARERHEPLKIVIHQRAHRFALAVLDLGNPLGDWIAQH